MRTDIAPGFSPTFDAAQRLSATCCTRCRRQRSFSGSLPARLEEIGREAGVDADRIEVWFADEARIGQKNKITRRWAKRGSRPSAPKDQRTASAYIFGAICPKDGKGAGLVMPRCDTEAMNLHLAEIATQIAPGAHAALLVDQAGWHLSGRLDVPPNITLVLLPAKCPELNPQENVWQFMRDNWLSNRVFKSYDDIVNHCCDAWNRLVDQPWKIISIGTRDLSVLISESWYQTGWSLRQARQGRQSG
jgi:putative transposase